MNLIEIVGKIGLYCVALPLVILGVAVMITILREQHEVHYQEVVPFTKLVIENDAEAEQAALWRFWLMIGHAEEHSAEINRLTAMLADWENYRWQQGLGEVKDVLQR